MTGLGERNNLLDSNILRVLYGFMTMKADNPLPDGIIKPLPPPAPPPKKSETINFCGIYDPEKDSPAIKVLYERLKREAECIIEKWEEQEQDDGTKNTKL